tara:strand:- start:29 stop:553 length:525 start_codon:yes stop_codon:yes gene_type:complete
MKALFAKGVKMQLILISNAAYKFYCYLISVFIFILDQTSKYFVFQNSDFFFQGINLIPGLNLVYVQNKGISFGLLSSLNISFYLGIFSFLISFFIILWIWKIKNRKEIIALSFILGGAIGNGYDRVVNSYVIDFIDFYFGSFHWPAFNFADSFITIGAIIYILGSFGKNSILKK